MASRAGAISISRRRAADTYVAWRPLLKDRPARSPPNTKELGSLLNANRHLWEGRDRIEVMACLQMLVYRGVFAKKSCATAMFGRLPSNPASANALSNKAEPRGGQGLEAESGPPLSAEPSSGLDGVATPSNPASTGALQDKAEPCDSWQLDAETGLPSVEPSPSLRQSALPHDSTPTDALRDKAEPCDSRQPDAAYGQPPPAKPPLGSSRSEHNAAWAPAPSSRPDASARSPLQPPPPTSGVAPPAAAPSLAVAGGAKSFDRPQLNATSGRRTEPPLSTSRPKPKASRARASSSKPRASHSSSPRPSHPIPGVAIPAGAPCLVEGERAMLYLRFRDVFAGTYRFRRWKYSELKQILRESHIPLENLAIEPVEAVMDLLRRNVFHCEDMAGEAFPWLHCSSVSAERAVSPLANAMADPEDNLGGPDLASQSITPTGESQPEPETRPAILTRTRDAGPTSRHSSISPPPLNPKESDRFVRKGTDHILPFKTQHAILTAAQEALEGTCFDWARKALPRIIIESGWDCPAAGELNRWVSTLGNDSRASYLLSSAAGSQENLSRILVAMRDLRQVAVHRYPRPSQEISQYVHTAVEFARLLKDGQRAPLLARVARELDRRLRVAERKAARPVADLETIRRIRAKIYLKDQDGTLEIVKDALRRHAFGEVHDGPAATSLALLVRRDQQSKALDRKERDANKKIADYGSWESSFLGPSLEEFVLRAFGKSLPVEFQRTPREAAKPSDGTQGDDSPATTDGGEGQAEAQG